MPESASVPPDLPGIVRGIDRDLTDLRNRRPDDEVPDAMDVPYSFGSMSDPPSTDDTPPAEFRESGWVFEASGLCTTPGAYASTFDVRLVLEDGTLDKTLGTVTFAGGARRAWVGLNDYFVLGQHAVVIHPVTVDSALRNVTIHVRARR